MVRGIAVLALSGVISLNLAAAQSSVNPIQNQNPAVWQQLMDRGMTAYTQHLYQKAEQLLSQALQYAEAFGVDDPRVADSANNLGASYYAEGKYAMARPLLSAH